MTALVLAVVPKPNAEVVCLIYSLCTCQFTISNKWFNILGTITILDKKITIYNTIR
jgi:hypothetical protein